MDNKKPGLGKGLSALFEEKRVDINSIPGDKDTTLPQKDDAIFLKIELDKIRHNPYQPREDFNEENLKELTESVKQNGIIQPVTVRVSDDKNGFELISGERRLRAAKEAGLQRIPAYIYAAAPCGDGSLMAMLELALIENIQRADLNPMELSNSFQRMADEFNLTQEEIAEKVSKQRSTIANFLRLQKLPAEIKVSLRKNEITEAHARMLLRVDDIKQQLALWQKIISENISVRNLEEYTKKFSKQKKKKSTGVDSQTDPYLISLESKLMIFFGTKVKVKIKNKFSGEIIVEYYNNDDLERIMDKCE